MYNLDVDDEEFTELEDCAFTVNDIKQLARDYLSLFFTNKVNHKGENIDKDVLLSERNVSLVLNMDICGGMPLVYEALDMCQSNKDTQDVELVLGLLRECANLCIPKCFVAGLVGVYVEICKGRSLNA